MASSTSIRRIVVCQGTIQTVTALSVLRSREATLEPNKAFAYEDHLVIHGLFSPPGQIEQFALFVQTLAQHTRSWASITYLTPELLKNLSELVQSGSTQTAIQTLHQTIGIQTADELYSAIHWQFGNELLLNAYPAAHRICYGDSIGFYVPANASVNRQVSKSSRLSAIPGVKQLKTLLTPLRRPQASSTLLKPLEFDLGCFFLPDLMGDVPPMPSGLVDRQHFVQTCLQLSTLVRADYVAQFQAQLGNAPVSIMLTSNFSEAKRMAQDAEIKAYRQFLIEQDIESGEVLVIKPHPRDNKDKIELLKTELADLYSNIILLVEPENFYTPFELFFMRAFLDENQSLRQPVRAFAFSTACFSLKWLFGVEGQIGFGAELVKKHFFETHQNPRIEHEAQLKAGLSKLN